jgi:putative membrane-bound dehydrogenase-like protein
LNFFGQLKVCFCALALIGLSLARGQDHSPQASLARMTATAGLKVSLVAAEPLVRQPVAIDFDDRGRLWVIQYLQYPNPEGLQRVEVDRYSRTKYDRIPEPPPNGPKGADRITILEDNNGDGIMDTGHDFVEGLNLATGLAFGHGGVFVLNVPYLLFYPDRNRDDVPDSDPEVLLSGFGMEDAHSVANSLTFGPDGWLYGCQGSTVTAQIRGIEFQQGVWRYHPITRQFELFCEGGGNSWGLDFDATGELLYCTNYGGHVLLHAVQGGYFIKSFAKHGQLHNPFAYGYFDHADHENFQGGHVTVGGIIYQAEALPLQFRGKYIAGDLLGHGVNWHEILPSQSTVRTKHGGSLLTSNDSWFAPTDITVGPDGAIYVSDWQDARMAHPDPDAQWDRSNGRIYRIAPENLQTPQLDLAQLTGQELLKLHSHSNQWWVRKARQELVRRNEHSLDLELMRRTSNSPQQIETLESLWTLASLNSLKPELLASLLRSPYAAVRKWAVRLLGDSACGDASGLSAGYAHVLDQFAESESELEVRVQLACTAARLPAAQALPIINANINRDIDLDDSRMPLLWWWAIEKHSVSGREEVLKRFVRPTIWKSRLGRQFLMPRLVRRYAAESTVAGFDSILRILQSAVDKTARDELWEPIQQGLSDSLQAQESINSQSQSSASAQTTANTTDASAVQLAAAALARHPLGELIQQSWLGDKQNQQLLRLVASIGFEPAIQAIRQAAFDSTATVDRREAMLGLLSQIGDGASVQPAIGLLESKAAESTKLAAMGIVAKSNNAEIGQKLLATYLRTGSATLQARLRDVLFSRLEFARLFLDAVEAKKIDPISIPVDQVRLLAQLNDELLTTRLTKIWGKLTPQSPGEILAEIRRLNNDLRAASGDAEAGQVTFRKHCMSCHQLFGIGRSIGPDLTTANRQDRDFLLASLVDPNAYIRPEYISLIVQTTDGQVLTGLPVARNSDAIELATFAENEVRKVRIETSQIEQMKESPVSIMPAELYKQLSPDELRDLFAFLQGG